MNDKGDILLKVEGLSKFYDRNAVLNDNFKEAVVRKLKSILGNSKNEREKILALKDVSFDVHRGEVIGVIGRNGSGKSTLLKILSEITVPTAGRIEINGRISSILEIGTGFHPDLSGRKNVFLSGKLLGMSHEEIDAKFDEIVDFSGIREFIEVPVKHYSSGMYLRLAFSVIAHLDSEIILFDEVLAVGDAEFKQKSFDKIRELSGKAEAIIIVSHELNSLVQYCDRVILLEKGKVKDIGAPSTIVARYFEEVYQKMYQVGGDDGKPDNTSIEPGDDEGTELIKIWSDKITAPANDNIRLVEVQVLSGGKIIGGAVEPAEPMHIRIVYDQKETQGHTDLVVQIRDQHSNPVFFTSPFFFGNPVFSKPGDRVEAICTIPGNFFNKGLFFVDVKGLTNDVNVDMDAPRALKFKVLSSEKLKDHPMGNTAGPILPELQWEITRIN